MVTESHLRMVTESFAQVLVFDIETFTRYSITEEHVKFVLVTY